MKKFVKMMVVTMLMAVTLVTSGTTKVYANEEFGDDFAEKYKLFEESLSKEYKEARDEYFNSLPDDCNDYFNKTREFYLNWG